MVLLLNLLNSIPTINAKVKVYQNVCYIPWMYCTLHTDIALIVLNKCLSIRSETVQFRDAEGITDRDLQKVHYTFEFIEDHQKEGQVTSQGDGNEAAEVVELIDLTPPVREEATKGKEQYEGERKEEGERKQEGRGVGNGDGRMYREEQGEARAEITEDQGEGMEDDVRVQEKEQEGIYVDNSKVEDVDFLSVNYHSKMYASDDRENYPPRWGPKGYHRRHHPLTLMVSYKYYLTLKGAIALPASVHVADVM